MKKALLAVLLLAGCQEKGTNRIEINGQVIEGENITIRNLEEDTIILNPQKEEYHIAVYYTMGSYCVKFTNDNWRSEEGVLSCDKSGVHRITFFDTKREAINIAKPLDTYEKAVKYNDSIVRNCSPDQIQIH